MIITDNSTLSPNVRTMDISFTPPLPNQIHLSIPPFQPTAILNFTAALSYACHAQFIKDAAVLQLWSDVCLDGLSADWCAFDFQTPSFPVSGSTIPIDVPLRVGTSTHERNTSQNHILLSLQLSVPLTSQKYFFSFTYRLVYPTGEIKWFGQYGQNGTIVLEQSQTDSNFILHEGWSIKHGGYFWTHSGKSVDGLEVAKLSSPSAYSIQSIGRESFFDAKTASLTFLVPLVLSHSVLLDPTYILSASPDITFTVSSSGAITVSGAGSLLLQTPGSGSDSDLHSLVNNMIAHCPSDACEALLDTDMGQLLLTSRWEGRHLLKVLVIPMIPRHLPTTGPIRIASNKLAALLPDDVTQFSIFSPLNLRIHFFTRPNEEVLLLMDPSGGRFVMSPVFNLKDGQCQLSILSSCKSIRPHSEFDSGNLLTPPSSPHLKPSSPPLSYHETSTSVSPGHNPQLGPALRNSSEDASPFEIQTPAPGTIILAYLLSMATFLFAPLYPFLFGRIGENVDVSNSGPTDEKESQATRERLSTIESESENQVTLAASEVPVAADDHGPGQLHNFSLHLLLVETRGGNVTAAFRSTGVAISTALIAVDLNGHKVDSKFTKLDEYSSLLEVDGGTGGLLKISVA